MKMQLQVQLLPVFPRIESFPNYPQLSNTSNPFSSKLMFPGSQCCSVTHTVLTSVYDRFHHSPWLVGPPSPSSQSVMLFSISSPQQAGINSQTVEAKDEPYVFLHKMSSLLYLIVFKQCNIGSYIFVLLACFSLSHQEVERLRAAAGESGCWRTMSLTCTLLASVRHSPPSQFKPGVYIYHMKVFIPPRPLSLHHPSLYERKTQRD